MRVLAAGIAATLAQSLSHFFTGLAMRSLVWMSVAMTSVTSMLNPEATNSGLQVFVM
jgi:hypothetical protein